MLPRKYLLALILLLVFLIPQTAFSSTQQTRVLYGIVQNASTGQPIVGVTVASGGCNAGLLTTTLSNGSWQLAWPLGISGQLTFSADGYQSRSFQVSLNAGWAYSGGVVSLQPT